MTLGEKIKDALNIGTCFYQVYFKKITCRFKDENGDVMEITNTIKALINETDEFGIIDDTLKISVEVNNSEIVVNIE